MNQVLKYVGYFLLIFVLGFLIWRFSFMIGWVLLATVISFIGHPLVRFFDRIRVYKWSIPHAVSTALSLLVIVIAFFGMIAIFVPLIVKQADAISRIDVNLLAENFQGTLRWLDTQLHAFEVIPADLTLPDFIVIKAKSVVSIGNLTALINSFFSAAGTIFAGMFAVLFIAFFFMKDENMFEDILLLIVPEKHHHATSKVISDSKNLLMRYFVGVLLEITGMMLVITLALVIFGVENALLIGFFGGIMNIIPYLGPVIGSAIGIVLGATANVASGSYDELFPTIVKIIGVSLVANFIDNIVLKPMIYSKSVKAHPLEIFFVIIMGGSIAGLIGMLVAIPVYTVIRIIAKAFFQEFRLVQKLTAKID
jgi:predicted PurR-regulated permease PerM